MRDHTDYETHIYPRYVLNRHVRKRFPHATPSTYFRGRCYHVGVLYNKQASPELCEALLEYRYERHDDIFIRARTAADRILSSYHMSPPGFPVRVGAVSLVSGARATPSCRSGRQVCRLWRVRGWRRLWRGRTWRRRLRAGSRAGRPTIRSLRRPPCRGWC